MLDISSHILGRDNSASLYLIFFNGCENAAEDAPSLKIAFRTSCTHALVSLNEIERVDQGSIFTKRFANKMSTSRATVYHGCDNALTEKSAP